MDDLKQQASDHQQSNELHVENSGGRPLLISASHSPPYIRASLSKEVDLVTGAIVLALAQGLLHGLKCQLSEEGVDKESFHAAGDRQFVPTPAIWFLFASGEW